MDACLPTTLPHLIFWDASIELQGWARAGLGSVLWRRRQSVCPSVGPSVRTTVCQRSHILFTVQSWLLHIFVSFTALPNLSLSLSLFHSLWLFLSPSCCLVFCHQLQFNGLPINHSFRRSLVLSYAHRPNDDYCLGHSGQLTRD